MLQLFGLTAFVLALAVVTGDVYDINIDDFFEDSQGWLLFRKEIISTKNKFGVGYPFTVKFTIENIGQNTVENVEIRDHFDSRHFKRFDIRVCHQHIYYYYYYYFLFAFHSLRKDNHFFCNIFRHKPLTSLFIKNYLIYTYLQLFSNSLIMI